MRFRCISKNREIVGAVNYVQEHICGNVAVFFVKTEGLTELRRYDTSIACKFVFAYVDDEGEIIEVDNNFHIRSNKIEVFIEVPEEWIGKLPGWERLTPRRIIEI